MTTQLANNIAHEMKKLGGRCTLNTIYNRMGVRGINATAGIRHAIESHSSDSEVYHSFSGKYDDIFHSFKGIRGGVWEVR